MNNANNMKATPVNDAEFEKVSGGLPVSPVIIIDPFRDDEQNKKTSKIMPIDPIIPTDPNEPVFPTNPLFPIFPFCSKGNSSFDAVSTKHIPIFL